MTSSSAGHWQHDHMKVDLGPWICSTTNSGAAASYGRRSLPGILSGLTWKDMQCFVARGDVGAAVSPVLKDCLEGPGTAIFTVVGN